MKKLFLLLLFCFCALLQLTAQRTDVRMTTDDISEGLNAINLSTDNAIFRDAAPFIALSATATPAAGVSRSDISLMLFYSTASAPFNFKILRADEHSNPLRFVSQLYFLPSDAHNFSFKIDKEKLAANSEVNFGFYNPGHSPIKEESAELRELEDCNCPQPAFEARLDWCPSGNCPEITNPVITDVTHLIVHHSAGLNTSSDWAAVVRGIWDYHVNSNGWDDVGYNWLIDPNGTLYEGRGDDVRGAHFCGNNTGTQGICMLGTYSDTAPTEAAMTKLKEYLAWKSANDNIDPTDVSFHAASSANIPNVAGHQDGCNTACPGASLYALMPALRADIRQYQARICGHPHAVTELTATLENETIVNLSWIDNASTEDAYLVQRATGANGAFSTIATLAADTEAYTDLTAAAATFYRYQVLSMAGDSTSTCQLEAEITTGTGSSNNVNILSESEVSISPNPAYDAIRVLLENEFIGEISFEINDLTSKVLATLPSIKKSSEQAVLNIDLNAYPPGVYFLKIKAGTAEGIFKIIVL